jgi:putative endonuclease
MSNKTYYIYIICSRRNGTLYIGLTNNLIRRIYEHKNKLIDGFTKKYNIDKLVYYECFESIEAAITREKYLKHRKRSEKITLIENSNPNWIDLYEGLF